MLDYPSKLGAIIPHDAGNTIMVFFGSGLVLSWTITITWVLNRLFSLKSRNPRGCRRLGFPPGKSNLHDEYDPIYSHGLPEQSTDKCGRPSWRVKALFAYPIKSCAGVELDTADVVPTGFALDRQFCFAEDTTTTTTTKEEKCKFPPDNENPSVNWTARTLRDRDFNRMALIRPEIWVPDPTASDYSPDLDEVKSQGVLVIYFPRIAHSHLQSLLLNLGVRLGLVPQEESFRVPFYPSPDHITTYPTLPVEIWKDNPISYDYGKHLPPSFHRYLSRNTPGSRHHRLTLFRVHPSHHRQIFRCAPPKDTLGFQTVTGFADAYPLHILNLASVRHVASRCVLDIPRLSIRRFRANVIIQGPEAFAEDDWKRILLVQPRPPLPLSSSSAPSEANQDSNDGVIIYTVCRTIRCRLPNVDPDTGVRHRSEPDRTLKSYRRIDRGDPTNACLGMQAVPAVKEFQIRVGDPISVLETGEHFYIKMLAPGEKIPGE